MDKHVIGDWGAGLNDRDYDRPLEASAAPGSAGGDAHRQ
jgi:hypothetical protein